MFSFDLPLKTFFGFLMFSGRMGQKVALGKNGLPFF